MPRILTILHASDAVWFRSRLAMQMEFIASKHQLSVYRQEVKRPRLTTIPRIEPYDNTLHGPERPARHRYHDRILCTSHVIAKPTVQVSTTAAPDDTLR